MADVTEVRTPKKWIVCSASQYKQWSTNTSGTGTTIDPYNLYLVNTGIEEGIGKYTELYYGYNRLTDIQIITNVNEETILNLPNDKLIVLIEPSVDTSENGNGTTKYTVNGLKIKYDDQIWSIADFSFKSLRKSGNTLIMEVGGNTVDGTVSNPIYIPILDSLPEGEGTGEKYLNDRGEYTVPEGGNTYTSGSGINISSNNEISVKIKSSGGLDFDSNGELFATGGGGGTTYTFSSPLNESSGVVSIDISALISALMGQDGLYTGSDSISINANRQISVIIDGQVALDNTGILTGGTVYNYLNSSTYLNSLINNLESSLIIDDGRIAD